MAGKLKDDAEKWTMNAKEGDKQKLEGITFR
jgi:hypothetical protein